METIILGSVLMAFILFILMLITGMFFLIYQFYKATLNYKLNMTHLTDVIEDEKEAFDDWLSNIDPTGCIPNTEPILNRLEKAMNKSALAVLEELKTYAYKHELEEVRSAVEVFKTTLTTPKE